MCSARWLLLMASDGFANTRIARGGGRADDGEGVAGAVLRGWAEGLLERAAGAGPQAVDPGGEGRGDRPLDVARDAAGRDALELPDDGRPGWRVAGDGAADLVRAGSAAASRRDVQALKRPAVRGEARRCRRPVPEPAGERDRAVHGREEPDPGAWTAPSRRCRSSPAGRAR